KSGVVCPKNYRRETMLRAAEEKRVANASVSYQPLRFADVSGKDQSGTPSERFTHTFVFPQIRPLNCYREIPITALGVFLQSLPGDRKFIQLRAEASFHLPLQHFL